MKSDYTQIVYLLQKIEEESVKRLTNAKGQDAPLCQDDLIRLSEWKISVFKKLYTFLLEKENERLRDAVNYMLNVGL